MARPDTRSLVLDSVLALLNEGSARLTYEAVAARAGVSRQTVYSHFPTRGDLLVAATDRSRDLAGAEAASRSVYEAATAPAALRAMVEMHASFVPKVLPAYLAVERERSADPEIEAAFARRAEGRRQLARHVAIRLQAEGELAAPWTTETASDVITILTSGTSTALYLHDLGWTVDEMRDRVRVLLERTLLRRQDQP